MCFYSKVIDNFADRFPKPQEYPKFNQTFPQVDLAMQIDVLKKLVADFQKAAAAAKVVDELTGQPDCEDPDKAKLVDRVADLEKRIKRLEDWKSG